MGTLRGGHPPRTTVEADAVFDPLLYARALKQIEDLYKSQGYLSARAGPPRLDPIGGDLAHIQGTIPIKEGEQTPLGPILVEGGRGAPPAAIDAPPVPRHDP